MTPEALVFVSIVRLKHTTVWCEESRFFRTIVKGGRSAFYVFFLSIWSMDLKMTVNEVQNITPLEIVLIDHAVENVFEFK